MQDDHIDRHDGFGTDVRVTSIEIVPGEHGAQIAVGFVLEMEDLDEDEPTEGSALLPFAAEWRDAQGFAYPELHAPWVAHDLMRGMWRHREAHRPTRDPRPDLPDRATQHSMLLEVLAQEGAEATRRPADSSYDDPVAASARSSSTPTSGSRWSRSTGSDASGSSSTSASSSHRGTATSSYLVFWEGDLVRSVREELPPVNGSVRAISELQAARDRGEDPYTNAYWSAGPPRRD